MGENVKLAKVNYQKLMQQSVLRLMIISTVIAFALLSSACSTLMIGVGSHHGVSVSTAINVRKLHGRRSAATRNNIRIEKRIRRIFADYGDDASRIRIKVDRGLVVLRGYILSVTLERQIVRRVSRIRGVHTIKSKMSIKEFHRH